MEEPPKKDSQNEVEKDSPLSELVEVVVETQAEVGASGYSVVGGGDRGIFIKEVLKDSPAAKHLSLQKGDQLLSARVYFDNVKYEDALQILQCAEPYKVSFFLKRTVEGSEISICPGGQNLELRGRKAKMQRMSVKSVKPFKAKKKRGGRFGLKRLKENKKARTQADLDIESSSGRSDLSPVDIEFVFPKFKMRKGGKATSDGSGQLEGVITTSRKKKKIRFQRMKATDAAEGEGNVNVDVSTHKGEAEVSGAKPKAKVKGPKFGIHFPKIKKSKLDIQSSNDNLEVKEPMVETDFSMAQGNAEANVPNLEVSVKGKGEGPEKKMPRMNLDVSNTKMTMPNIKMPNIRLSCHSDETDGEASMKMDTSENKLKMPMTDIKAQTKVNLDLHLPKTKGTAEIKNVEIHDPNVKGTKISTVNFGTSLTKLNLDVNQKIGDDVDGSMVKQHEISLPKLDLAVSKIETSDVNISLPTSDRSLLKMTEKHTDSEGLGSTGEKCEMPKLDISLPKITSPESEIIVEEPAANGKRFNMPSVDISLSKGKLEGSSVHEGDAGKRGKFEIPQMDISLSTIKLPDVKTAKEEPEVKTGKLNIPNVSIPLTKGKVEGKGEIEGPFVKGPDFKVTQIGISLPKTKLSQGKIDIEEPEIKSGKFSMPCIDISLPKGTLEGDVDIEGHSEKGGKFKIPSVDVSQPNMKLPEGDITEEPEIKSGTFNVPSIEISLPKGKAEEHVEVGDLSEKGGKFKMPHVAVLLPKMKFSTGKINTEDPEVRGEKFKMPSFDIYLPKGKAEFEGHSGKSEMFDMPKIDLSLPKMSLPERDISIEGPDVKLFSMTSVDLSLPKVTSTGDVDIKRHSEKTGKFDMLKQDFYLPKIESTKGELNVEGPEFKGGKFHIPSFNISSAKGKAEADVCLDEETKKGTTFKMPTFDIHLPQIKSTGTETNIEGPEVKGGRIHIPDVDISLPQKIIKADSEGHASKGGKFHMPQVNLSLPKLKPQEVDANVEGPKRGQFSMPAIDLALAKGKGIGDVESEGYSGKVEIEKIEMPKFDVILNQMMNEGDIKVDGQTKKQGKFQLPQIDISLPRIKRKEVKINVEVHEVKGCKAHIPSTDISLPKDKTERNTDVHSVKGIKLERPKIDISMPNVKAPEGEIRGEASQIKGGKLKMPSVEISLSNGKAEGNIGIEGKTAEGRTFNVPKFDICKSSEGEINIDDKCGKFQMPFIDISLPRRVACGDVDVEGHAEKGRKCEMPKNDVSLPKFKSSGGEINVEGPDIKGKKFHMPSVHIAQPRGGAGGDVDAEVHAGKGRKFEMPKFDVSMPKLKGVVEVEGTDNKGKKFHMPSVDISLPRGGSGGDVDAEGDAAKGRKFELPQFDVSLPKLKGEVHAEGPDIKGGMFHIPAAGISLAGEGASGDDEGHVAKGRKFGMPKFNIFMPKFKTSGGEIDVEGPDLKGGKFHMPSVDISLPGGGASGDQYVEGHAGEGKFDIPKFDISLAKLNSEVDIEGPDIKGGTFHMPSVDISLPGGAGGDVVVEGHTGKERKFNMPKFDINLPKFKTSGGDIDIEGPDLKGGKFCMPSVDISQPGVGAGGDLNVEGHARKGRKFEVPKFDVSMPKFKTSVGEINIEGPDSRGRKFHMPSVDISLPEEGAVGDLNVEGHARKGKFEMPKFDISLPKLKGDVNVEGPGMKCGTYSMSAIDISSPEGKGGGDFDSKDLDLDMKGQKFNLPSIDISLPKVKMEGDIAVESSNTQEDFEIPKLDISLPKIPSSECDVKAENPDVKGDKLHMPSIDISLTNMKQEKNMTVEGQARKGGMFQMSSVDISLPEGTKEGGHDLDDDIEKDGKFHMPSYNISLPKIKLTEHEHKVESTDKKARKFHMPDIDISLPKMTHHSNVEAKATGGNITDLNYPEVTPGGNIKLPTVKIPIFDISAPKFDLDFTLQKGKGSDKENIELLKAEGGRPSSRASFDVPEVSVKMPKMSLPKFGKKLKSGGKELESPLDLDMERRLPSMETDGKIKKAKIKIPSIGVSKIDVDMSCTDAEIKIKTVAEEITKPEIQVESPDDKVKYKLKFPKFKTSSPKAKLKYAEMDMSLHTNARERGNFKTPTLDNKGKVKMPAVEISLPTTNMTECEVLLPKSEVDVSEKDIQGYEGNLKIPKMPTIDISFPKVYLDVSLPKVNLNESADSSDLNIDNNMGTVNFPHIKIPKVDISIPHGKTGDMDSLEVDFKGGKFKLPKSTIPPVDTSVPNGKTPENCPTELEIRGGRHFNMSEVKISNADTSLPLGTTGGLDDPKLEVRGYGSIFKKLDIKMPDVDISLPKGKIGEINVPEKEKFQMPNVDIVVPRIRSSDFDVPELELRSKLKMPAVEISLPHAKTDTSKHAVETKGDKLKMPNISKPIVDISLPLRNTVERDDLDSEFRDIGVKLKMPDITVPKVDLSLSHGWKRETHKPDSEVDSGKLKTPKVDISHPKIKSKDTVAQETQAGEGKGKVTIPGIKLPTVDIVLPHVKTGDTNIKMTKVAVSHEKTGDNETPEQELEVKEVKIKVPDIKIPKVDKSLLQRQQEDTEETETTKQGDNFQLPKIAIPTVDLSLPHSKTSDLEALESVALGGGQRKIKIPKVDITLLQDTIGESDTKKAAIGEESGKFMMPNVKIPKLDISIPQGISKEANMSVPATETVHKVTNSHKVGKKFRIPTIYIEGPKGGLEINLGLSKEWKKNKKKIELPDIDLSNDAPKGRMKRPKVKGSKFNIGMPKVKSAGLKTDLNKSGKEVAREGTDVNLTVDLQGLESSSKMSKIKIPNVEISSPTIKQGGVDIKVPEKSAFTKPINTDVGSKRERKQSNIEITTPKFPDLDIDNRTAQVDTDNAEEDKKQAGKAKIPKFGIPLPSLCSPETNIKSSQIKCHSVTVDSEIEYEGPRMPKVQKAVFVMVNPQMESLASLGGKASAEIGDEKLPKIKMKQSFGKSQSNEKGKSINGKEDVETEGKPKSGKLKLPKVTFSSGKTGSFDVTQGGTDDGTGLNLNGDKDEKAMFGKLKLPKVEFFSPYSKEIDEEEDLETSMKLIRTETSGKGKQSKEAKTKSGKMSFPGEKNKTGMDEEMGKIGALVFSKARTEMLAEWERSESPIPTVSSGFISGKKSEEGEETTWLKVPKVTLSSHSTGILQITPEGSPRRSKSSLPCSSDEASGGFYVKMPRIEFSTQEMSSENVVTETKEGTLTVKKVTKYTESRSSSSKQ